MVAVVVWTCFRSMRKSLLAGILAGVVLVAAQLPAGFQEEGVAFIDGVSTITFVPQERQEGGGAGAVIFAALKKGVVQVVEVNPDTSGNSSARTILDMTDVVCNNGERGMHQVVAHPDFLGSKRFVYISYSFDNSGYCGSTVSRVSRFAVHPEDYLIDRTSERVLIETNSVWSVNHFGGDLLFGNDGHLYMTFGDNKMRSSSQDLGTLTGKILRLTEDGEIPLDNPFQGNGTARCNSTQGTAPTGLKCQEILSYGLRNPYRFSKDPNTNDTGQTLLYISDVGQNQWEEINKGGTDFAGMNYGWPEREGPCALDSATDCAVPLPSATTASLVDPMFWYNQNSLGAAVTGVAAVPNGLWPSPYDNAILHSEYVHSQIFILRNDVATSCRNCTPPTPSWSRTLFHDLADSNVGRATQLIFGPYKNDTTQALYYVAKESTTLNIRRIFYDESLKNRAPTARISASSTSGAVGSVLMFDGSQSSDPDEVGDQLHYEWDFGDGGAMSTAVRPLKQFSSPGNFNVQLVVTDAEGLFAVATIVVTIGIDPPLATITSPAPGTTFAVGDVLTLVGSAVDGKGADLDAASSLTWEVRQHHNTHFHPFLDPTIGNNITLPAAPSPEDFSAAKNSYLEVLLTATDRNGYSGTNVVIVIPKMVTISFASNPSGLTLLLDGYTVTTPVSVTSWVNHPLSVQANDQNDLFFQSWSDGGAASHVISVQQSMLRTKFTATFSKEG